MAAQRPAWALTRASLQRAVVVRGPAWPNTWLTVRLLDGSDKELKVRSTNVMMPDEADIVKQHDEITRQSEGDTATIEARVDNLRAKLCGVPAPPRAPSP